MWRRRARLMAASAGIVLLVLMGSLLTSKLQAPSQTARVHGIIYSCPFTANNCATPAASLVVQFQSVDKHLTMFAVSDSSGHYSVNLVPDQYIVKQKLTINPMGYAEPIAVSVAWATGPGELRVGAGDNLNIDLVAANSSQ